MQVDSPQNLYNHPDNVFVAGFIGSPAMNLLELPLVEGGAQIGPRVFPLDRDVMAAAAASGRSSSPSASVPRTWC